MAPESIRGRVDPPNYRAGLHIPEHHVDDITCGSEQTSVGTEGHGYDGFPVIAETAEHRASLHVPELYDPSAAGGKQPPIGAEGHRDDLLCLARESGDCGAGLHVPELYGLIRAANGERAPIWAEGHRSNTTGVPIESVFQGIFEWSCLLGGFLLGLSRNEGHRSEKHCE